MYDRKLKRTFIEVIQPGAVTEELLRSSDVKALLEHNSERMLARSFNGKGSLTLSLDEHGVKYRFDAPNTVDGDSAVEMVKRGDLFGSSFAYYTNERSNVKYEKTDEALMRYVTKIDWIGDVSIVSDPAYMGTDVAVRSLDVYFENNDEAYKEDVKSLRELSK